MSNVNFGPYVILDDGIDHAIWATDYRFPSVETALKAAKKKAWKDRRDYYVAQVISGVELEPADTNTTVNNYLTGEVMNKIEDKENKDV